MAPPSKKGYERLETDIDEIFEPRLYLEKEIVKFQKLREERRKRLNEIMASMVSPLEFEQPAENEKGVKNDNSPQKAIESIITDRKRIPLSFAATRFTQSSANTVRIICAYLVTSVIPCGIFRGLMGQGLLRRLNNFPTTGPDTENAITVPITTQNYAPTRMAIIDIENLNLDNINYYGDSKIVIRLILVMMVVVLGILLFACPLIIVYGDDGFGSSNEGNLLFCANISWTLDLFHYMGICT